MNEIESAIKAIAFYLPQFHPIPENDAWWGKGFTEWTNVARAKPLFPGHYQPHLPADLGFYDLRVPEVRAAQAALAREYGVHGFCYYHYWFQGRRLLERPFNEVLASGEPDFPFCLCWANENWSRNWDGGNRELLVEQTYSEDDDRRHIEWLLDAFEDDRYIRINGRPLMLIYRAKNLPSPQRTTQLWRDAAIQRGWNDLYLCRVESFPDEHDDPTLLGFDAAVEFQPDWTRFGNPLGRGEDGSILRDPSAETRAFERHHIYDYSEVVERMRLKTSPPYRRFPCVTPCWDNSPRRANGDATILRGSTPRVYQYWLTEAIRREFRQTRDEHLVFINAWNEWAEGNHLEPDLSHGRAYLEATRQAIKLATHAPVPTCHSHRIALARELAVGRDVLNLDCANGYGSLQRTASKQATGPSVVTTAAEQGQVQTVRDNVNLTCENSSRICIESKSVDLLIGSDVFQQCDDYETVIGEIRRVLRPEGVLFVSIPVMAAGDNEGMPEEKTRSRHPELKKCCELIERNFRKSCFYQQRFFQGSVILPFKTALADGAFDSQTYGGDCDAVFRAEELPATTTLIALATDGPKLPSLPISLFEAGAPFIEQLESAYETLESQHKILTQSIQDMRRESQCQSEEAKRLRQTYSWRLTAPLRFLTDWFRERRRSQQARLVNATTLFGQHRLTER